jgi:hypothetical protein
MTEKFMAPCKYDGKTYYLIGIREGVSDKHSSVFITDTFVNISKETFLKQNPEFNA